MTHICISKLGHCWLGQWFVACLAPSHYLNQCSDFVNWILRCKLQWNFNRNSYFLLKENAFENIVHETAAILSQPQCVNSFCAVVEDPHILPENVNSLAPERCVYSIRLVNNFNLNFVIDISNISCAIAIGECHRTTSMIRDCVNPIGQEVITWTNDDHGMWHHMVFPSHNLLM